MRLQPNEMANAIYDNERADCIADGIGFPTDEMGEPEDLAASWMFAADDNRPRREVRYAA